MNEWKKERKNKWMNELTNVQFKCYTWTIKKQQMKDSPTLSTFYSLNNSHRWKILDDKCKYDKWKISKLVWLNEIYIYSIQSSKKGKKNESKECTIFDLTLKNSFTWINDIKLAKLWYNGDIFCKQYWVICFYWLKVTIIDRHIKGQGHSFK